MNSLMLRMTLTKWVKETAPNSLFKKVEDIAVVTGYAGVCQWASDSEKFSPQAKSKFLSGADPWLVAYANANDYVIATYEVSEPVSKSSIKLPDAAIQFGVECCQPREMIRSLDIKLRLSKNSFKN